MTPTAKAASSSPIAGMPGSAASQRGTSAGRLFNKPPLSTVVALAGAATVLLLGAAGVEVPLLGAAQLSPAFKYVTGTLLLLGVLLQWKLFDHREEDERPILVATWYRRHKILGAALPFIFLAHTASFGNAANGFLSLAFFVVLVSGVLNRDLINVRSPLFWQGWTVLHVGAAFAMCALIALHVWTAVSFHS